jgi:hypothetical protein
VRTWAAASDWGRPSTRSTSRQGAGPLHRRGHHEQRGDGDHALVAHPLEGLVRREHAGGQEEHDAADHHHVGGPLHEQQEAERHEHDGPGEGRLPLAAQRVEERKGIHAWLGAVVAAATGMEAGNFPANPRGRKGKMPAA